MLPWAELATKSDLAEIRGEMATMSAELIEKIADAQTRIQATTSGTMIGLSGLVFAVASLAR